VTDAHAQVEAPAAAPVEHWTPGVGDATGPLGVLLGFVLILDRFGLLPKKSSTGEDDKATAAADVQQATATATALAEVKKDVEHLAERQREDRAEQRDHRKEVAGILTELRTAIAAALDNPGE